MYIDAELQNIFADLFGGESHAQAVSEETTEPVNANKHVLPPSFTGRYTIAEVAEITGLSDYRVRKLIRTEQLKASKFMGNSWQIPAPEVERLLQERDAKKLP